MVSKTHVLRNGTEKSNGRVVTGFLTGAIVGTTAALFLTQKNGKEMQNVVKEKFLNGSLNKKDGRFSPFKVRSAKLASNTVDPISAALHTGMLAVTSDTIVFPKGTSKRFQNLMADKLFPGQPIATIADRFSAGDVYRIPLVEANPHPALVRAVKMMRAQQEIKSAWERSGRDLSPIGLPLDPNFSVSEVGQGKYAMKFRSGYIEYDESQQQDYQVTVWQTEVVTVRLVAILCLKRQESTDEVFGVFCVHGPANELIETVTYPKDQGMLEIGDDGPFITYPNIPLAYEIPVEDLYIRVAWIEHDSGDEKKIARQVADKFKEIAQKISAGQTGIAAEATAAAQDDDISYGSALFLVGSVLGMGDDPYPVESAYIPVDELLSGYGPKLQPPYKQKVYGIELPGLPTVDKWTHSIKVVGEGEGSYRFFFDVERRTIIKKIPVRPVPE